MSKFSRAQQAQPRAPLLASLIWSSTSLGRIPGKRFFSFGTKAVVSKASIGYLADTDTFAPMKEALQAI
jgi:hypothetical protein